MSLQRLSEGRCADCRISYHSKAWVRFPICIPMQLWPLAVSLAVSTYTNVTDTKSRRYAASLGCSRVARIGTARDSRRTCPAPPSPGIRQSSDPISYSKSDHFGGQTGIHTKHVDYCRAMLCKRGVCRHAVSVCLSRSWILSKRVNLTSDFFIAG